MNTKELILSVNKNAIETYRERFGGKFHRKPNEFFDIVNALYIEEILKLKPDEAVGIAAYLMAGIAKDAVADTVQAATKVGMSADKIFIPETTNTASETAK